MIVPEHPEPDRVHRPSSAQPSTSSGRRTWAAAATTRLGRIAEARCTRPGLHRDGGPVSASEQDRVVSRRQLYAAGVTSGRSSPTSGGAAVADQSGDRERVRAHRAADAGGGPLVGCGSSRRAARLPRRCGGTGGERIFERFTVERIPGAQCRAAPGSGARRPTTSGRPAGRARRTRTSQRCARTKPAVAAVRAALSGEVGQAGRPGAHPRPCGGARNARTARARAAQDAGTRASPAPARARQQPRRRRPLPRRDGRRCWSEGASPCPRPTSRCSGRTRAAAASSTCAGRSEKLVVEIDGIHHTWAENVVGDALQQRALVLQGDAVLRLPLLGLRLPSRRVLRPDRGRLATRQTSTRAAPPEALGEHHTDRGTSNPRSV